MRSYQNQVIMKKIFVSLIALMAVMTMQAQSICGTWRSIQPIVKTDQDGSFSAQIFTYSFYEDGTFACVNELTIASEPAQTMALEVATNIEFKGKYTLDGNKLTLMPNMDTYKTEIISISKNGRVITDRNISNDVKTKINSDSFKSQFAGTETNTVDIGNALLQMSKGNQTHNYARLATIRN